MSSNLAIPIKRKTTPKGGFLFIPGNSEIRNERRSREFESVRGERRDRPLAGCHDRADAADAEGVNLAKSDFGEAKTRRAKVETK